MGIPRIIPGLELVDDEGDEVTVSEIDESEGTVELETSDGDSYSMSLRELRSKLRDGEFAAVEACEIEAGNNDGADDEAE